MTGILATKKLPLNPANYNDKYHRIAVVLPLVFGNYCIKQ